VPQRPLGPLRFDFHDLPDEDFEEFCFLTVGITHPTVFRLRAPDDGADAAVASRPDHYEHCWQFKRFGGHIHWSQCEASFHAAVKRYRMPRYTFCFARDLTSPQAQKFAAIFAKRHPGTTVDWLGHGQLVAALTGSDQGERIRRRYFGEDARDTTARFVAAMRAGGDLSTGADAVDRLRAITEQLDDDPVFAYQHSSRTAALPHSPPHPEAIVSLEVSDGKTAQRFDAIPRNPEAMRDLAPGGRLAFEASPTGQEALERFQASFFSGEQVKLDKGVTVTFDRMPELFGQIAGPAPEQATIIVGPGQAPPPWNARLVIRSSAGNHCLDVNLTAQTAPAGWQAAFGGSTGPLDVALLFRRLAASGQATMNYTYHHDPTIGWSAMLEALDVLLALHGEGTVEVQDRDGRRPTLPFELPNRTVSDEVRWHHSLARKMAILERAAGVRLVLPDRIDRDLYRDIVEAAYIVEHGESGIDFDGVQLDLPVERFQELSADPPPALALSVPITLPRLSPAPILGYLSGQLSRWVIKAAEPVQVGPEKRMRTTITPQDDEARHQKLAYSSHNPMAGSSEATQHG
jgi:hypothetical protein